MVYSVSSGQRLETDFLGVIRLFKNAAISPFQGGHVSCVTTCAHPSGEGAPPPPRKDLKNLQFSQSKRDTDTRYLPLQELAAQVPGESTSRLSDEFRVA
jgi:hypothetical protein